MKTLAIWVFMTSGIPTIQWYIKFLPTMSQPGLEGVAEVPDQLVSFGAPWKQRGVPFDTFLVLAMTSTMCRCFSRLGFPLAGSIYRRIDTFSIF